MNHWGIAGSCDTCLKGNIYVHAAVYSQKAGAIWQLAPADISLVPHGELMLLGLGRRHNGSSMLLNADFG